MQAENERVWNGPVWNETNFDVLLFWIFGAAYLFARLVVGACENGTLKKKNNNSKSKKCIYL